MTEDEIVGWHHQLNGREFEQAPRVGDANREAWRVLQSMGSHMTEELVRTVGHN